MRKAINVVLKSGLAMTFLTPGLFSASALAIDPFPDRGFEGYGSKMGVKTKWHSVKVPQIPIRNFEWTGTFRVPGEEEPVVTDLTISGKWQNGFFNLYMEQGFEGNDYWVENFIFENHLYTITHTWPGFEFPVTEACFKSYNEITVHDLNEILLASELVGRERIDGKQMNHFRATCLSKSQVLFLGQPVGDELSLNIFSDIYVPPGRSYPWGRWLQYGDGVGLSKQWDEWFFFDKHTRRPQDIELPWQCLVPGEILQFPCSNLDDNKVN